VQQAKKKQKKMMVKRRMRERMRRRMKMTEKGSVLVEPTPRIRAVRAAACEECGETRPSLPENEKQNKTKTHKNKMMQNTLQKRFCT